MGEKIEAFQDGGQFYEEGSGKVIADYGDIKDYDMANAIKLRARFTVDHPGYFFKGEANANLSSPR